MSFLYLFKKNSISLYWELFTCLFFIPFIVSSSSTLPNKSMLQLNNTTSSCKEMLESFAYTTSNFTSCAIRHARPITLCQSCVTFYLEVKAVYAAILEIEDMGGGLCRDQLTNLDRLQVVGSGFDYVDQLWSRAFCDSCFTSINGKLILTDEVSSLLNASAILDACITTYHNTSEIPDNVTCLNCVTPYMKLNNLYNNMKADSGEINFCMDIIDMMNSTRNRWSKALGCCNERKKLEKTFISIVSGILVASVLFYVMVYAFTRKAEQPIVPQKRWKEHFLKRPSISSAIAS